MAFDDSTGGADWRRHHTTEPLWGDDFGDRSPASLFAADRTARERDKADLVPRLLDQIQQAILVQSLLEHAQRRRSAPVEAKLKRERASKRGTMGVLLAKEFARTKQRDKKR